MEVKPRLSLGAAAGRVGLAALLSLGLALALAGREAQVRGWSAEFGWTGIPGPALDGATALGQACRPARSPLGFVAIRFATYEQRPAGTVQVVLLAGDRPPADLAELQRRTLAERTVRAGLIGDNQLFRFDLLGFRADPQAGLYLLVLRPAGAEVNPLAGWLDQVPGFPGPPAQRLGLGDDGRVTAAPLAGHLSLAWGYDQPSLPVYFLGNPWRAASLGLIFLVLSWLFLRPWPGLARGRERLAAWTRRVCLRPAPTRPAGPRFLPWVVLAGALAVSLVFQGLIKDEVYFSGDAGLKALLMKQFSAGVLRADLRLAGPDWAERLWDQGLYPFAPLFVTAGQGKRYIAYAPVFALASAPFYKLFGLRGMYLWPLLGAWLGWLLLLRATRRLGLGPWATAIGLAGLGLATPLVVYGATFWEHTLNAALGLGGLVLLFHPGESATRSRLAGGSILGLSLWLRPETVALFGPAVLVLLATGRRGSRLRAAAGAGVGLLLGVGLVWLALWPLYGRDILTFGQPLGHHSDLAAAGRSFAGLILQANQVLFKAVDLGRTLLLDLAWYCPLVYFSGLAGLAALALAEGERRAALARWSLVLGLFLGCAVLMQAGSGILAGRSWGPRYVLVILPAAALLAGLAWEDLSGRLKPSLKILMSVVLVSSLAWGAWLNGWVGHEALERDYAERIRPALVLVRESPGRVVAVADQLIAQELAGAFEIKLFFRTETREQARLLAGVLAGRGERAWLFLDNDGHGRPAGFDLEQGGRRLRVSFEPLGKFGRYQASAVKVGERG